VSFNNTKIMKQMR